MIRRALVTLLALASLLPSLGSADEAPEVPVVAPPVARSPAPSPILFAPDLRPRIFVKDLDHLAELVKEDPAIAGQARELAVRQRTAYTVAGLSLVAGLLVTVVGATQESCDSQPVGIGRDTIAVCHPSGGGMMMAGGLLSLGGLLAGAVLHPKRSDLLHVVNGWNVAHGDRPIELFPVPAQVIASARAQDTGAPTRAVR